jgi:hypothetical protein
LECNRGAGLSHRQRAAAEEAGCGLRHRCGGGREAGLVEVIEGQSYILLRERGAREQDEAGGAAGRHLSGRADERSDSPTAVVRRRSLERDER